MTGFARRRRETALLATVTALVLTGCSERGGGSSDLVGVDAEGSGAMLAHDPRVETELEPIIAVEAAGRARAEDAPGTANDRFEARAEIARSAFAALAIDRGDGFRDENVVLTVERAGATIFSVRLPFVGNDGLGIRFETKISGVAAPELQAGDVARVSVNGTAALQGTFRRT
jgi:hypothetical protein